MSPRWIMVAGFAAAALGHAAAAAAQRVDVHVASMVDSMPVAGAALSLVDERDSTVAEVLSNGRGNGALRSSSAGVFRIRVRRIGFTPFLSDTITLTSDRVRALSLVVPFRRAELPTVIVSADRKRCSSENPATRLAGSTLWEAIRTGLVASELTRRDSPVETHVQTFERTLDDRLRVLGKREDAPKVTSGRPFAASDPVALSRDGYVVVSGQNVIYSGPDAGVLLSAEFEADHCFGVEAGSRANRGFVGLSFTPVGGREVSDIAGTVWVDSATSQLKYVEYRFINAPTKIRLNDVGGRVEFERLPSGSWIVSGWVIRMPRIQLTMSPGGPQYSLLGYLERGGVVTVDSSSARLAAEQQAVQRLAAAPVMVGRVIGTAYDSLLNRPLANAVVRVEGTTIETRTDSAGRFTIDSLVSGTHHLTVRTPWLDSIGLGQFGHDVTVVVGQTASTAIAVRSLASIERGVCADSMNVVTGVVHDASTNAALAAVGVRLRWLNIVRTSTGIRAAPQEVVVRTDSTGRYAACVAPHAEVTAVAASAHDSSGRIDVEIGPRRVGALDLYVGGATSRGAASTAIVHGRVRDPSGLPIAGVVVGIDGTTRTAITDSAGAYRLGGVPYGTQALTAHRVGFAALRTAVVTRPSGSVQFDLTMHPVAELAPVRVRADAVSQAALRSEFAHRRKLGFGFALGPDEITQLHVNRATSLLENFPGLMVTFDRSDTTMRDGRPHGSGHLELRFMSMIQLGAPPCEANVYVDGHYTDPDLVEELRSMAADQIAAMEVYQQPSEAPAKYTVLRNGCGVVLIWTKSAWGVR